MKYWINCDAVAAAAAAAAAAEREAPFHRAGPSKTNPYFFFDKKKLFVLFA